ncbi:MAG: pimelyl-ACP methyl ester esterase BioV [Sulfuricurvum sp.]
MTFYSGFSLLNDRPFFESFCNNSDYTVAGFSYGAIHAARHVLQSKQRIDTLQLFSPAFFQTKSESFKRLQLTGFSKSPQEYLKRFAESCFAPCEVQEVKHDWNANAEQLRELLYYEWTNVLMKSIVAKGIRIEVFLGLEDKVIDVLGARDFFLPFATVTSIRTGNHFLQECTND